MEVVFFVRTVFVVLDLVALFGFVVVAFRVVFYSGIFIWLFLGVWISFSVRGGVGLVFVGFFLFLR